MQRAYTVALQELEKAEKWATVAEASFWVTAAQKANLKNIRDTRSLFTTWSTTWRGWAERGYEPSGKDYTPTFWGRIGGDLVSALKVYTGGLYDGSVFAIAANTAIGTASDFAAFPGKAIDFVTEPWSLKAKLALAAGGVVALLVGVGVVSRTLPFRAVRAVVAPA